MHGKDTGIKVDFNHRLPITLNTLSGLHKMTPALLSVRVAQRSFKYSLFKHSGREWVAVTSNSLTRVSCAPNGCVCC